MPTVHNQTTLFSVYSQRCAGFLMQRGFPLMDLTIGKDGRNVFLFKNSPALHDAMDRWMILRAAQQSKSNT